MKLLQITIKNYRSIDEQTFVVEEKNKSYTFSLIGINESGKSSFLSAISLFDDGDVTYPRDFHNKKAPIEVSLRYKLETADIKAVAAELAGKNVDKAIISQIEFMHIDISTIFDSTPEHASQRYEKCTLKKVVVPGWYLNGSAPAKKTEGLEADDLNLESFLEGHLPEYFYKKSHFITLWKSDPAHLIGEPINLDTFAADPKKYSVPLHNCFRLAGIVDIKGEIEAIKEDAALRQNLEDKLADSVTAHIKSVWPNHPVEIKFNINNMMLEFLIEDDDVKYSTKTTEQRSDGFKQFVSFLLTISAEHATSTLSRSLLLLDEPETHLHPKAQEFLKEELIKITRGANNNIVFYATHSSYMIDRGFIGRCYKVEKKRNKTTEITKLGGTASSYAEINYDVFGILSTDYHNELYGVLQEKSGHYAVAEFDDFLESKEIKKDKTYLEARKGGATKEHTTTLPTYIRHLIHHPENGHNTKYTDAELERSTKALLKVRLELSTKGK